MGQSHTCVIVSGGGVKCWGYNGYGQLGNGGTSTQYSPMDVSLGSGLKIISCMFCNSVVRYCYEEEIYLEAMFVHKPKKSLPFFYWP